MCGYQNQVLKNKKICYFNIFRTEKHFEKQSRHIINDVFSILESL